MHLRGDLALDDGGWPSGGYLADRRVDGQVNSDSRQQWLSNSTATSRAGDPSGSSLSLDTF